MKQIRLFLSLITCTLMFSSCATLITGTTSKVTIDGDVNANQGISKIKPRVRHLINVKEPHFLHFEA
jgi:hypothetical protein